MNIKMILVWPLAFITMLFSLAFPPKAQGDISAVYAWHGGSGATTEFKVDLERKNLWRFEGPGFARRDEEALFDGFCFIGRLNGRKIAAFLEAADENGFIDWEGRYAPEEPNGPGFGSWHVTVVFTDGTKKESNGYRSSTHGPAGYAAMAAAFKALTGMDILANV